ncbi:unnamed protein product [Chrysoparadoxa australica]
MGALREREAEIYDRQIRLWGVEAQQRMSSSKVLFAGFSGACAEASKNLVLAGFNATIQDSKTVSVADLGANFFLRDSSIGGNRSGKSLERLQALNSMASVECVTEPIEKLPDSFFQAFQVVCLCGASLTHQKRIDGICREKGIALYIVECFGQNGYIMMDLGKHSYRPEKGSKVLDLVELVYPTVSEACDVLWSDLQDRWGKVSKIYVMAQLLFSFQEAKGRRPGPSDSQEMCSFGAKELKRNGVEGYLDNDELEQLSVTAGAELSPICAILGGLLGQEVVKAISLKGEPALNVFVLDGNTCQAKVFRSPKAP